MQTVQLIKTGLLEYEKAWELQKDLHKRCLQNESADTLILTEHPHTYTIGRTGSERHLIAKESALNERGITVYRTDRGGDITYHGPGQIVGYPIFNLHHFYLDVGRFLRDLEETLILMLADFDLTAGRIPGLTGVWVEGAKIAAIGIKVSRWITMHGFALNVNTDLSYFGNIVPCGIADKPVTSLEKLLHQKVAMNDIQERIIAKMEGVFRIDFIQKSVMESV